MRLQPGTCRHIPNVPPCMDCLSDCLNPHARMGMRRATRASCHCFEVHPSGAKIRPLARPHFPCQRSDEKVLHELASSRERANTNCGRWNGMTWGGTACATALSGSAQNLSRFGPAASPVLEPSRGQIGRGGLSRDRARQLRRPRPPRLARRPRWHRSPLDFLVAV